MPDTNVEVLFWDKKRVIAGYRLINASGISTFWISTTSYQIYPTHWMPLPEPPKQEK